MKIQKQSPSSLPVVIPFWLLRQLLYRKSLHPVCSEKSRKILHPRASIASNLDAEQNDGRCEIVPRLPRETKVDVRLCHACHAKWRGAPAPNPGPRAPPSTISGTPATQNDSRCEFVPRLPRETKVDVRLCHACHAKWRGAPAPNPGPRAPPSTISGTPATQNDSRCEFVPRLPRETKVDVRLCHACHAKWRGAPAPNPGPRAPPSTISGTPATQNDGRCEIVPRLPRETKVDVRLCHACHAKWRGAPAPNPGPRAPPSTISGSPATQNDSRCEIVPRLPRETKVDVRLCHACHAKCGAAPRRQIPAQGRHPVP